MRQTAENWKEMTACDKTTIRAPGSGVVLDAALCHLAASCFVGAVADFAQPKKKRRRHNVFVTLVWLSCLREYFIFPGKSPCSYTGRCWGWSRCCHFKKRSCQVDCGEASLIWGTCCRASCFPASDMFVFRSPGIKKEIHLYLEQMHDKQKNPHWPYLSHAGEPFKTLPSCPNRRKVNSITEELRIHTFI